MARTNSALSIISLTTEAVAKRAGVAGIALAPIFVILDFVNDDWTGGAFAAAGLTLGLAVTVAVPGPVGGLVGGLITALFSILPGLFEKAHCAPPIDNMAQIIQWKFFGEAEHTGNEQCRKQNPNCKAVYGPGT